MSLDSWLLAVGIALWSFIFLLGGLCLYRVYLRAKETRRLLALEAEESRRIAREFEETHPTSTRQQGDRSSARASVGASGNASLRSRVRVATDILLDAIVLPPRSATVVTREIVTHDGLSVAELDQCAPLMLSPKAKPGADSPFGNDVTCSICLEDIEPETMQRMLLCSHVYHPNCIKLWCSRANRCPQCQAEVLPKSKPVQTRIETGSPTGSATGGRPGPLAGRGISPADSYSGDRSLPQTSISATANRIDAGTGQSLAVEEGITAQVEQVMLPGHQTPSVQQSAPNISTGDTVLMIE